VDIAPKPEAAGILSFYMGKTHTERKDYIMENIVVSVEGIMPGTETDSFRPEPILCVARAARFDDDLVAGSMFGSGIFIVSARHYAAKCGIARVVAACLAL